jgi:hypothetical protein
MTMRISKWMQLMLNHKTLGAILPTAASTTSFREAKEIRLGQLNTGPLSKISPAQGLSLLLPSKRKPRCRGCLGIQAVKASLTCLFSPQQTKVSATLPQLQAK